ncbi:6605_t:CDS:2, partial [Funneliformis mosseae]
EIMSSKAICNRMLFQLMKQPNDSWNNFKNRYDVTPEYVLRRIAKHRTQEIKDLNVIIILDGLQFTTKENLSTITSLQPPKINNIPVFNDSSIMNMFIDDMVGHGRSLEALGEAVVDKDMT